MWDGPFEMPGYVGHDIGPNVSIAGVLMLSLCCSQERPRGHFGMGYR